jgi:glycogen debranching enzyme
MGKDSLGGLPGRTAFPEPHLLPNERLASIRSIELPPRIGVPSVLRALHTIVGTGSEPVTAACLPEDLVDTHVPSELRLFEALFSRDALIVADMLDVWHPKITDVTVLRLAELQGVEHNERREEEPGRIPHEVRSPNDPVAVRLTESHGWEWPYYGSVDATCLWIIAARRCMERDAGFFRRRIVSRDGRSRTVAESLGAAVRWLIDRLTSSPFTLLESRPMFDSSISNQFWKDSRDAYSHADGTLAQRGTVASIEAQALAYDALLDTTHSARRSREAAREMGIPEISQLLNIANQLRESVLTHYWVQDRSVAGEGFFALATDRNEQDRIRPLAVLSSNMGHLLMSSLLDAPDLLPRRRQLIESLFDPSLFCAAGFRTLATRERRFRVTGYHTGNSWPWDSYWIARGLRRCGYMQLAAEVCGRVVATCNRVGCFPEFVAVDRSDRIVLADRIVDVSDPSDPSGRLTRIEQPPQLWQAWTVAAVAAIKRQLRPGRAPSARRSNEHELELLARVDLKNHM